MEANLLFYSQSCREAAKHLNNINLAEAFKTQRKAYAGMSLYNCQGQQPYLYFLLCICPSFPLNFPRPYNKRDSLLQSDEYVLLAASLRKISVMLAEQTAQAASTAQKEMRAAELVAIINKLGSPWMPLPKSLRTALPWEGCKEAIILSHYSIRWHNLPSSSHLRHMLFFQVIIIIFLQPKKRQSPKSFLSADSHQELETKDALPQGNHLKGGARVIRT